MQCLLNAIIARVNYLLNLGNNNQPLFESCISVTIGLVVLDGLSPDNLPKPACLALSNSFFLAVERKALNFPINNFQNKNYIEAS